MRNLLYLLALAAYGLTLLAAAGTPAHTFRAMALDGDTDGAETAYTHTAFAWLYYTSGRQMRGVDVMEFSYLETLERPLDDFDRAARLVSVAVKQTPDLVPASDVVLALNLVSRTGNGLALLCYIMDRAPNCGSVKRACATAQPIWGGTFDDALFICATYAEMVPDVLGYDADVCLIDAAFTYEYGDQVRNEARKALRAGRWKHLRTTPSTRTLPRS